MAVTLSLTPLEKVSWIEGRLSDVYGGMAAMPPLVLPFRTDWMAHATPSCHH